MSKLATNSTTDESTDSADLELAKACAQTMWDNDSASQRLGMSLDLIKPGSATMSMKIEEHMTNGFAICHGGYIFLLADSTFAFSCNTYNRVTVAQGCSIEFLLPAHAGERLTAIGREIKRGRNTGVYDIEVINQQGQLAAIFRGKSYSLDKAILATDSLTKRG